MRIISGTLKGKRFYPPKNIPARPTTDFAKEALFNILNNYFDFSEVKFLDLFAGTGSLDMEIFSRGCTDITSVDMSKISLGFIKKMSEEVKIPNHKIIFGDAVQFAKNCTQQYDLIFAGPPYALEVIDEIPDIIFEKKLLKAAGIFILETSPKHNFVEHPKLLEVRNYGQTHFWFFGDKSESDNESE
ncbi:MAG TPA: RsmD family RNA methyltransferase [Chitinophagales bacterium]|jgi:16S rRNA (guanine966-N2)-methyltransferase|nr:RsmD family RNA methyltransferase [Chitinophagales bacterium]MBP6155299.1 RsmD family RNA methyltransferase [Chitinophagales bacterium]HQV78578.1 RsmD family RNA methyltransferase [Chitinophagales bacterium]HQW79036.1 RsmD family RNA methyltransferase [Chitinophagales bacterium]HRB20001.1 RsmD family RNA methyltransferase [Chitinophagales bacterium]